MLVNILAVRSPKLQLLVILRLLLYDLTNMIVSEQDAAALPSYKAYEIAERVFRPIVNRLGGYAAHNAGVLRPLDNEGYFLAPNHRSNWDSFALGLAMLDLPELTQDGEEPPLQPRAIRYMAKDTLWRYPLMRDFIEACGTFSVKRGRGTGLDDDKVTHVEQLIEQQAVMGMYPEGHRETGDLNEVVFEKLKTTIGFLSIKYGIPIVPVGIAGPVKGRKLPRTVVFGEPIYPEKASTQDEAELKEKKTELMVVLHGQINEAYQEARRLHEQQFGVKIGS